MRAAYTSAARAPNAQEDEVEAPEADQAPTQAPAAKKQRTDYSAFKVDVARLQKSLQDFEHDLKEHTLQARGRAPPPPVR